MYLFVTLLIVFSIDNGETQGYCGTYHGNICKNYVGNNSKMVWYNNSGGSEHEEITRALWKEVIETFNEPCRGAAEVIEVSEINPY